MVKSVLCSILGDCPLPVVVYLDGITIYRDIQEQVLEDMLEAVKWLAAAIFILSLYKIQVVQGVA